MYQRPVSGHGWVPGCVDLLHAGYGCLEGVLAP